MRMISWSYWSAVQPGASKMRAMGIIALLSRTLYSYKEYYLARILLVGVLSRPMRRSSSTANAILGLLALRPSWSTWELTTQLRRNMRFFWPRAESRIFAEARRLEAKRASPHPTRLLRRSAILPPRAPAHAIWALLARHPSRPPWDPPTHLHTTIGFF